MNTSNIIQDIAVFNRTMYKQMKIFITFSIKGFQSFFIQWVFFFPIVITTIAGHFWMSRFRMLTDEQP